MFGFGELFREEGEEVKSPDSGSSQSGFGQSSGSDNVPVPPRLSCGLGGIYNQGATCYMNSLLQTLVMTPEFRERLFQLGSSELGSLQNKDKGAKVRVIPIQLQRLFARLLLLNAQGASTTELTDSFGWTNNEELVQHDVQELNRILFSAIEDSLVGTSGGDLIQNLYHGSIVNQITCLECGRISDREEDFLDLSVAVSGSPGLENSLTQCYVETEALDGKNQYRCEACNKLVDAKKGAKLRHLPPILTVSLLRFSFDFQRMERYKETGKFTFPMEIDMGAYVENLSTSGCTEYKLFSVVIHGGGAHGGHYTAYIRDIDNLGTWTHPDEDDIQLSPDPSSGKVDYIECDTPVDLVKAILGKNADKQMKIDTLCAEVMKQTGVSWNKRFKRQHGPINKFLRRYDDIFKVSPDNLVSLKETSDSSVVTSGGQLENSTRNDEIPSKGKTKKRSVSPPPKDGHGWFHFNDCRVYPARTKELEAKYSGKACAYMLFYRSKSLSRSAEVRGSRQSEVSPDLLSMICEENAKLEEERVVYETKINTIMLKLLFPSFYTFKRGALQANDDSFNCVEISIDRRKTIEQLVQAIKEMYEELCTAEFGLYVAKIHPAGVHIYHCVSDKADLSIKDSDISNRSRLFVWDGKQIDGEDIPTGAAKEPIQITVTYGNPSQLTHGFPKSLTMGELRHMLRDMTGVELDKMALSRVVPEGEDTKIFKVLPEEYKKTLQQLDIANGEQFVVENSKNTSKSNLAEQTQARTSRLVSFVVENRCINQTDGEWSLTPVEVDKDSTVEEVKAVILSRLSGAEALDHVCRLRYEDDNLGLMPPLHEAQDLESAGLKQGMKIVLEHGEAPQTNEFTLNVSSGDPKFDLDLEVIADRNMTLASCLKLIVEKAGKTGDEWHLRKTNWCGEAAAVLDDLDSTLTDCQLKNGDKVLLEQGQLPPKGFLKLEVFLFPSPVQMGSASPGILSSIVEGLQGLLGQSPDDINGEDQAPVKVGDVVVSKDVTLEDLKYTVLTLPGMEKISVPMIEFLRLRNVERGRVTGILRNAQQTLQRLKLTGGSVLGVQILPEEEVLSNDHMVLDIRLRKPNTKTYHPGKELVWDVSQNATFQGLRQRVADLLALPGERLVMAKHMFDKYDWLEIQERPHTQVKGQQQKGKKGKNPGKVNLKHAPYHLRDGDVIAVKDLEFDPQNHDDFSTQADLEGRERLQQEAEERKKRREELRKANAAMGNAQSHRKEVGIKIHVDNFR